MKLGWNLINGEWYYKYGANLLNGKAEIDGKEYCFENGIMMKNTAKYNKFVRVLLWRRWN